jgi:hypothetical protein
MATARSPRRPAGPRLPGRSWTPRFTYGCYLDPEQEDLDPVLSAEHQRIGLFAPAEIAGLVMPQGYKTSIATWLAPRPA